MKIESVPVASLHEDPANARAHGPRNLSAIEASLARFGQQKPIVVGAGDVVVAGNGTLRAAIELGWESIDIVRTDLEGADRVAFAIADNRTAELAEWEDETLAAALASLAEDPTFDLDVTGFDEGEVDALLRDAMGGGGVEEGETPEPPADPVTRPGDLWTMGEHRLLCGDSTSAEDVDRLNSGETPFIMVTDPPYGVEYDPAWRTEAGRKGQIHQAVPVYSDGKVSNDERVDWGKAWSMFRGAVAYVWHGGKFAGEVAATLHRQGLESRAQIVWKKPSFAISRGHYHWQHEPCWYAVRKGATASWCGDRSQSTFWDINQRRGEQKTTKHGTQKPVECMARPIRNHGAKGDVVYDPFLGSGTTLIAADQLDRRCYAIEIEPEYVDVAVQRWQNLTGRDATLDGDGRTFAEIAAERGVALEVAT